MIKQMGRLAAGLALLAILAFAAAQASAGTILQHWRDRVVATALRVPPRGNQNDFRFSDCPSAAISDTQRWPSRRRGACDRCASAGAILRLPDRCPSPKL